MCQMLVHGRDSRHGINLGLSKYLDKRHPFIHPWGIQFQKQHRLWAKLLWNICIHTEYVWEICRPGEDRYRQGQRRFTKQKLIRSVISRIFYNFFPFIYLFYFEYFIVFYIIDHAFFYWYYNNHGARTQADCERTVYESPALRNPPFMILQQAANSWPIKCIS